MKKWSTLIAALAVLLSCPSTNQAAEALSVGIVKFRECVEQSKVGKQEHEAFEGLRQRMAATLESKEKALNEIAEKFQDPDMLDSMTAEAEAELKNKFRMMSQDLGQYQNEYYQQMNQANMRVMHQLTEVVASASNEVAKAEKLDVIVNEDNCFYFAPGLDVTKKVISVMDKRFEENHKS